jgi:hypothetical protein
LRAAVSCFVLEHKESILFNLSLTIRRKIQ